MREVTKKEFYATICDQRLDVHPRTERHQTTWLYRGGMKVFGKESTGYASDHHERTRYFLAAPDEEDERRGG